MAIKETHILLTIEVRILSWMGEGRRFPFSIEFHAASVDESVR